MLFGFIDGKELDDLMGYQTLGAFLLVTFLSSLFSSSFDTGKRQKACMAITFRALKWVPWPRYSSLRARAKAHRRKTSLILARGSMPI